MLWTVAWRFICFCFILIKETSITVLIEKDENGVFVGKIPELRSCYTQANTLAELYKRLEEVASLCIEAEKEFFSEEVSQNQFMGVQRLELAI